MLRPMARTPQVVLTIHGVSPDRTWQDRAAMALGPHFRCVPITYRQYGSLLGAFGALFNLSTILALCGVVVWYGTWRSPIRISALTLVAIVASVAIARYRRRRVVDVVKRQISLKAGQRQPHVIAHSFGTYISGWALEKFQDLRFGRIVLVGSVLPRNFKWQNIRRRRPDAFKDVRNDIGLADSVVWLLKRLGRIAPDMGTSGLFGFLGSSRVVHRSSRAWGPCLRCVQAQKRPLIHDIFLAKYRHSDWALGPGTRTNSGYPIFGVYPPANSISLSSAAVTQHMPGKNSFGKLWMGPSRGLKGVVGHGLKRRRLRFLLRRSLRVVSNGRTQPLRSHSAMIASTL